MLPELKPDPVVLLRQLVAIPSVSGEESALAHFCEAFLSAQGFACEHQALPDGRFNLLAVRGQQPRLLLYAHLDTVPADPAWAQDPFELTETGDRLTGLGASDMKGGLAVILSAVASTDAPVRVALGADEEVFSAGAWTLVGSDWCKGLQAVLVPELSIDSESEHLGIGRRGHESFRISVLGSRRHGALTVSPGQSDAIERAAELVLALRDLPLARHPRFGTEALLIRSLEAQAVGFSVPDRCDITLSVLTLPGRAPDALRQQLAALCETYGAVLERCERPTPVPSAYALAADHPLIAHIQQQARQVLGTELPTAFGVSVADENVLATLNLPVLSLAPVGGASHRAGEWVSRASLERVTSLYRQLLESADSD